MIRKSAKVWLTLFLLSGAGCNSIHDCINDAETSMVNHVLAQKAWNEWSWCYDNLTYPTHFAKGFKDGYESVLAGGKGCQPTLPPRLYWKPCYKTAVGRCKIAAWFDGFSHGALAAQQDGYGQMGKLPISPSAHQNWMSRQAPASAACFDGMYHGEIPDSPADSEMIDEHSVELPPMEMGSNGLQVTPMEEPGPVHNQPYDESTGTPGN